MDTLSLVFILITVILASLVRRLFSSRALNQEKRKESKIQSILRKKDAINDIQKAGSLSVYIEQQHDKVGDIIEFNMQNKPYISISNPEYIASLTKVGSRPVELFDFITPVFGKDNIQIYRAPRAALHRKFVLPFFSSEAVSEKFDHLLNITDESIIDTIKKSIDEDRSIEIQAELLKYTFKMIIYFTVG
jgi:hypothetical protein